MIYQENTLSKRVRDFIDNTRQAFSVAIETDDPQVLEQAVVASIRTLADEFGTSDYGFNLSVERYIERFSTIVQDLLPEILKNNLPKHVALATVCDQTNIAFVTYYALSLIYKKQDSQEKLKNLMDEKYSFFTLLFPLAFEVRSRYYKRVREYDQALSSDKMAIEALEDRQIKNYALGISFAATVCRMYEMGYTVEAHERECAEQYICEAIEFKPDYPKYHFLRGKLLFYANRGLQDLTKFNEICKQAQECLNTASRLQAGQAGAYSGKAWKEYNDLIARISQERRNREDQSLPFRHFSQQEFREQIAKIINSSDSRDVRPPNPKLKAGQKFLFISYSQQDYKSVYCDLMTLYTQKIPFQYDGGLPTGSRWDTEVHEYISKEECVGVIFFVSQHTLLSEAIEKECRLALEARKNGKRYFSINLEGKMPPSEIMMNSILRHGIERCLLGHVDSERMVGFLTTFHDDIKFIAKYPDFGPDGTSHIPELINSIKQTFPTLEIGEQNASAVGV